MAGNYGQPVYTGKVVSISPGYYLWDQDYCLGYTNLYQGISCSFGTYSPVCD